MGRFNDSGAVDGEERQLFREHKANQRRCVGFLQPDDGFLTIGALDERLFLDLNAEVHRDRYAKQGPGERQSTLERLREIVKQILYHRSEAELLFSEVQSYLREEENEQHLKRVTSEAPDLQLKNEQRQAFWFKYRNNVERQDMPIGQVQLEERSSSLHKAKNVKKCVKSESLLKTESEFWKLAEAGRVPKVDAFAIAGKKQKRSSTNRGSVSAVTGIVDKDITSWTHRAARGNSVVQAHWPLAQKLREEQQPFRSTRQNAKALGSSGCWRSSSHFHHQDPSSLNATEGLKGGFKSLGTAVRAICKTTSLPSLHASRTAAAPTTFQKSSNTVSLPSLHGPPGVEPQPGHPTSPRTSSSRCSSVDDDRKEPTLAFEKTFLVVKAGTATSTKKKAQTNMSRYMTACQVVGVLPTPLTFLVGTSWKLNAANLILADKDVLAVAAIIRGMPEVDEVDLAGNGRLTDKALVPLLQKMYGEPAAPKMQRLNLSGCVRAGQGCVAQVIDLLAADDGLKFLKYLDLSGISVSMRHHLPLCHAVGEHNRLESVLIREVGLGNNPKVKQCISLLLRCPSLRVLDLSWNCFVDDVFMLLGQEIAEAHVQIHSLSLANCSSASRATGANMPMNFFLEQLRKETGLTNLDLSMNRIDFTGGLIIEDSLAGHPSLQSLDLSQNPLGFYGLRSLIRLYAAPTSRLREFQCAGSTAPTNTVGEQTYRPTSPEGFYTLDFSKPYHRSLMRMLYKLCRLYRLTPKDAFRGFSAGKGVSLAQQPDASGDWCVPSSGTAQFTFSTANQGSDSFDVMEENNRNIIQSKLEQRVNAARRHLPMSKLGLVLGLFSSLIGRDEEQRMFINVLSKDFILEFAHISQISCNRQLARDAVMMLTHCASGGDCARYLCSLLVPSRDSYQKCRAKMLNLLQFTPSNPSDHYKLDLSNATDYELADRLRILDQWETAAASRRSLPDTSRTGNGSQFRNECYDHRPVPATSMVEWELPESGLLEFDYIGGLRPPAGIEAISDDSFEHFITNLSSSRCTPEEQYTALRAIASHIFIKSVQLRKLLGCIYSKEVRHRLFAVFHFRIADVQNLKICRARFPGDECRLLSERLGHCNFFPYIQPEQMNIDLNFQFADQRQACANIFLLSQKEQAFFKDPCWVREDGSIDKLEKGIPRTWSSLASVPKAGGFTATYISAPETRNLSARRELLSTFGRWPIVAQQVEDVTWWSSLADTPDDVVLFVQAITNRFNSLEEAFLQIDGEGGNGVLSLNEFQEYMEQADFKRFGTKKEDKIERYKAIFRFLDATGEGTISMEEWSVLESIVRELDKQTEELYSFMKQRFGGMAEAWDTLNCNGDDLVSHEEWQEGLEKAGYFGASRELFFCLNRSGSGDLTKDEFLSLSTGRARRRPALKTSQSKRMKALVSMNMIARSFQNKEASSLLQ